MGRNIEKSRRAGCGVIFGSNIQRSPEK